MRKQARTKSRRTVDNSTRHAYSHIRRFHDDQPLSPLGDAAHGASPTARAPGSKWCHSTEVGQGATASNLERIAIHAGRECQTTCTPGREEMMMSSKDGIGITDTEWVSESHSKSESGSGSGSGCSYRITV